MRTSVMHFAELGNPLATEDDWNREVALAANPNASTRVRESALEYVRAPKPYVRPTKLDPRDYPVTNPEKLAQARLVRENLKLTLRAIEADKPKPMLAEARKPKPALDRPEPGFVPLPEREPKTHEQLQAEHRQWLIDRQIENLAKTMGVSPSEIKERLA